jgi:hypothetical protein
MTKVFLGYDWLKATNPSINWWTGKITCEENQEILPMRKVEEWAPNYCEEFPGVFSEGEFREQPPWQKWDHWIDLLEGHVPPWGKCYPLAAKEKEALKKFVNDNLKDKRIKRSDSSYASPFFFRPKQGMSELRGIQDYRKLNEITVKDRYPLPLISDILQSVQGSRVYTKMDLRWGFNNIQIWEGDERKAAFITPMGLFKPAVMQFGLCNAPSTFQWMVDEVLAEEKLSRKVVVYIDDILVHTKDAEENRYWTRRVLQKLQAHRLYCRKEKCIFEEEVGWCWAKERSKSVARRLKQYWRNNLQTQERDYEDSWE